MMIHKKDASERCRKGSSPNMEDVRGKHFLPANIEQIEMKTCQKRQRQGSAKEFLIPRDACDVIWLNLFRLLY